MDRDGLQGCSCTGSPADRPPTERMPASQVAAQPGPAARARPALLAQARRRPPRRSCRTVRRRTRGAGACQATFFGAGLPAAGLPFLAEGAGLSSSTKVVAVQLALIVERASAFSLPFPLSFPFTERLVMFTMRENLPMRSKNWARS